MLGVFLLAIPGRTNAQDSSAVEDRGNAVHSGIIEVDTVEAGSDDILVPTGRFVRLEGLYPFFAGGLNVGEALGAVGEVLDLESVRGKTVLLDFWASWCRPCIEEIPETNEFAAHFADSEDFVFISVNQDVLTSGGDVEYVRNFVRDRGIEYPVLVDQPAPSLKRLFRIRAWPTRIMISPEGEILERPVGRLTLSAAAEYLRRR